MYTRKNLSTSQSVCVRACVHVCMHMCACTYVYMRGCRSKILGDSQSMTSCFSAVPQPLLR